MYELNLFQEGSSKALSKVPARFQDWSGFSGRAFSRHHPPAPEIKPNTITVGNMQTSYFLHHLPIQRVEN
jgi:hypothetical protein